jgi:hypothetical protein
MLSLLQFDSSFKFSFNLLIAGYDHSDNSWVAYEEVYTNTILKTFVAKVLNGNYEAIMCMIENVKQTLKSKFRKTLSHKSAAQISMEDIYPFDYFEYTVMVAAVFTKDDPEQRLNTYLSELVFKNYFYQMERYHQQKYEEISKKIQALEGIYVEIENWIDFDGFPAFEYIGKNIIPDSIRLLSADELEDKLLGCSCKARCTHVSQCCNKIKEQAFSYGKNEKGHWILKNALNNKIYECGPYCACDLRCNNRLTQRPPTCQYVIFKDEYKGWGVKAKNFIERDTFLFEYCGQFIDEEEADESKSKYIFEVPGDDGKMYSIDALRFGNIARFVNHSCNPNTDIYRVNDCMSLPENM